MSEPFDQIVKTETARMAAFSKKEMGLRKEGVISVAGQPAIEKKERQWTVTMGTHGGLKNIILTAWAHCPCGHSWDATHKAQRDVFVPCAKCGSRM